MKNKTITNGCGGKKTRCGITLYILPYDRSMKKIYAAARYGIRKIEKQVGVR